MTTQPTTGAMSLAWVELESRFDGEFLLPDISSEGFYEVETTDGTECVPVAVINQTKPLRVHELRPHLSGKPLDHHLTVVKVSAGWCVRTSAPGYLDCTPWAGFATFEQAIAHLEWLAPDVEPTDSGNVTRNLVGVDTQNGAQMAGFTDELIAVSKEPGKRDIYLLVRPQQDTSGDFEAFDGDENERVVVNSACYTFRKPDAELPVINMQQMQDAYIVCALWSSTNPDDDGPLDADYSSDDIAPADREWMNRDCENFWVENMADIKLFMSLIAPHPLHSSSEQVGHDFWLTRNRHGAGFWDRGAGDVGDRLTEAANAWGEMYLFIADHDGLIHCERG